MCLFNDVHNKLSIIHSIKIKKESEEDENEKDELNYLII